MKTILRLMPVFLLGISSVLNAQSNMSDTFTVKSKELGGQLTKTFYFNDWGVGGENISPGLEWSNAPQGTEAFAVTMYDPGAPTGSGWWHWVLFNIPKDTQSLKLGAGTFMNLNLLPKESISSLNDFGKYGYGGPVPIPGSGFHPYMITVYALKSKLKLDKNANPALVGFNLNLNTIAKASLVAYVYVP
nr:YbhB/YbcL family Raf kinase inhibitor-like protein [uncultured Chryseobacterium sp.]